MSRQGAKGAKKKLLNRLEANHTTHIEGTHLTLEQAERLLAGETVAGTDPNRGYEPGANLFPKEL